MVVTRECLVPVKSSDVQLSICVDYLAIKNPIPAIEQCIQPELDKDVIIQKIVFESSYPDQCVRLWVAKLLQTVDSWILDHPEIQKAIFVLRADRDDLVREEAERISFVGASAF